MGRLLTVEVRMHESFCLSVKLRLPTPGFITLYSEAEVLKCTTNLGLETYYLKPHLFPPKTQYCWSYFEWCLPLSGLQWAQPNCSMHRLSLITFEQLVAQYSQVWYFLSALLQHFWHSHRWLAIPIGRLTKGGVLILQRSHQIEWCIERVGTCAF